MFVSEFENILTLGFGTSKCFVKLASKLIRRLSRDLSPQQRGQTI
jgi:hypothetical protein